MKLIEIFKPFFNHLSLSAKRRVFIQEVASKEVELLTLKDFAQRVCDTAGCTPKETTNVILAIDEASSNIIRHTYQKKSDGKIKVEIGVGLYDLQVTITDYGKPFDFWNIKDPDLNQYVDIGKKGGLGIWLIKKVTSRVQYKTYPDHNELIFFCRLSKAPPSGLGLQARAFSVSTKFTVGSVFLVSLLIFLAYFFLARHQESATGRQQMENMNLIVESVASEAGSAVVRKNDLDLNRMISRMLVQDQAKILDYVFIVGEEGKFLAHSDMKRLFNAYQPPPEMKQTRKPGIQSFRLKSAGGMITDYANPIFFRNEWVGEIHLGVSDSSLQKQLKKLKAYYRGLFLLIWLISITGLFFLSRIVINPFKKILEGMHAIRTGNFNAKIDVDSQDEFGQLATVFNDMTVRIQESQKSMTEQERMRKEMQVAQEIQHTLLPEEFPQIEGYEIGATYRAAKEVGGDYYDFFWVDPTTLGIVVADVSGKGVPGSMVMTMIRTALRLEARGNKTANDVLGRVNHHMVADMKKGMFVTMFYIILDSRNRSINFASAGHNPMILYRERTKEIYYLKPKGFPVGFDLPDNVRFEDNLALQKVDLEKNDMLVIYTDGITEAMNVKREQFGEARLVQVVRENYMLTPAEFVEKLNDAIARFTRGAEQNDDITVVAIKEKMKAEQVEFKFRKKLIELVKKQGLSVAEACRQMNISPKTYYRFKKIFDKKGKAGLKPIHVKKRHDLGELSLPQTEAVMALVKEHPEYGPERIAESLRKSSPLLKAERRLIQAYLKRKRLGTLRERKSFVLNIVDTVREQSNNASS
jgi:serine phosphatase RsbU (regulator of sigma subunit)/anti-sigma regulatory factor (Ser/Thr protein kinase)/transposase